VTSGRGKSLFDTLRVRSDALDEYLNQERAAHRGERARWVGLLNLAAVAVAVLGLIGLALTYRLAVRSRHYLVEAAAGEAANLAKDEFLEIASHELKTPVTSIKGHAQMLLRQHGQAANSGDATAQRERALRHANAIDRQSTRLTRLIEQLLEVTGAESKVIALEREPTDLVELALAVVEQFRPVAPLHPITVVGEPGGIVAEIDRHRIEQVLFNLVDNAIKYSPEGGAIDVTLSRDDRFAICAVRDRGVGVASVEHRRVFERFYRATNVIGTSISGMGVGLYISRAIILRHGGRIWLESEPGRGSTFYFSAPLRA
jgi:signal transduction histidine kinase